MAVVPDITAIELNVAAGSATEEDFVKALHDYFDSSISSASGSSIVSSVIHENHSGGANNGGSSTGPLDSPNFDLVANTNSTTAFTIEPQSSETWHLNIKASTGNDYADIFIDPQGGITDATTSSTSSTGNPTPSPEQWGFYTNSYNKFYVVEFDDAFFIFAIASSENRIDVGGHAGKVVSPYPATFGDGFGYGAGSSGGWGGASQGELQVIQYDVDKWATFSQKEDFNNGWDTNDIRINFEDIRPDTGGGKRSIGYAKYMLNCSIDETPGVVLDGGTGTDYVFAHDSSTSSNNEIIPWDASITPIFQ